MANDSCACIVGQKIAVSLWPWHQKVPLGFEHRCSYRYRPVQHGKMQLTNYSPNVSSESSHTEYGLPANPSRSLMLPSMCSKGACYKFQSREHGSFVIIVLCVGMLIHTVGMLIHTVGMLIHTVGMLIHTVGMLIHTVLCINDKQGVSSRC